MSAGRRCVLRHGLVTFAVELPTPFYLAKLRDERSNGVRSGIGGGRGDEGKKVRGNGEDFQGVTKISAEHESRDNGTLIAA